MQVYFVRHGRTKGNQEGRYVGRTDEGLLPESVADLKKVEAPWVDLVIASPMERCIQTAEAMYPGIPREICPDLREMDFGDFEYKNYKELSNNADYQAYIDSGGSLDFPGAESIAAFKERCCRGFVQAVEMARKQQRKSIAFVVHGGTIMAILEAYGVPKRPYFQWQIKNGERIEGELDDTGKILIRNR